MANKVHRDAEEVEYAADTQAKGPWRYLTTHNATLDSRTFRQ